MAGQKPSQQSYQHPQFQQPHPQFQHPQFQQSHPQFQQSHPRFQHSQHGKPPCDHQSQRQSSDLREQDMRRMHDYYSRMYADMYARMCAEMYEKYLTGIKKLLEQFVTVNRRNAEEAGVDAANAILQDQKVMRLLGPQIDGCDMRALMEIVGNISDNLGSLSDKIGRLSEKFEKFDEPRVDLEQKTQNSSDETVSTQLGVLIKSFNDLRAAFEQKQNSPCLLKSSPSRPHSPHGTPATSHRVRKKGRRPVDTQEPGTRRSTRISKQNNPGPQSFAS